MKPVMRSVVLTVEDISALLHALVGYYRVQEQVMPDPAMLLVSRLASIHSEMIQEEAENALYRKKSASP